MIKMISKKSDKLLFVSVFLISLFLITNFSFSAAAVSTELEVGDWLIYEVLESNDTENVFYGAFPPLTYFGNWSVVVGDKIIFNLTSVTEESINGTLFFGNDMTNTTFTNVRNVDAAFGLTIGIGSWNGGFCANASDWSNIQSTIQSTNTTTEEASNYEHSINENPKFYDVMKFDTKDYFGQFTTLFYHKTNGVLLKAVTLFGSYNLSIEIISTNLEIEGYTKRVSMDLSMILLILPLTPLFKLVYSHYRKKKR